jgi:hypothetical protein
VSVHKVVDGKRERVEDNLKVIEFSNAKATTRHGVLPTGEPRPYKGYKGDSNYCIEIIRNEKGKWEGEVISTFEAYQLVRTHGLARLRHPKLSVSGKARSATGGCCLAMPSAATRMVAASMACSTMATPCYAPLPRAPW